MSATPSNTPRTDVAIERVYGGSKTPPAVYRNPITDLCQQLERDRAKLITVLAEILEQVAEVGYVNQTTGAKARALLEQVRS